MLAASAVISEFLASNSTNIVDQDGNHSDWIEIQNTTTSALNIGGWYLTNDASNPTKWQFPSTTIAAGGFLTVFASGKDRHVSGQELHTNFSLDATGGYLALEMPDQSDCFFVRTVSGADYRCVVRHYRYFDRYRRAGG